jgi:hypothetical protein
VLRNRQRQDIVLHASTPIIDFDRQSRRTFKEASVEAAIQADLNLEK